MKKRSSKILIILSVICLLAIAGIIIFGLSKRKNNKAPSNLNSPEVLGQLIETQLLPTVESNVRGIVQEVFSNSKEEVVQKVENVRHEVLQSIQKEVSNLTQSQIDSLKLQICTDLGVIPAITLTPSP